MNEKQEYAEMLDLSESTCNITVKKPKKSIFKKKEKKPKNADTVKAEVIEKINAESEAEEIENNSEAVTDEEPTAVIKKAKKQGRGGAFGVGVGIFAVVALTLSIILTNALFPNSAINVFFRSVFGVEERVAVDVRTYSDFKVEVPAGATLGENGVLTVEKTGSLYTVENGTVDSVSKGQDGKYTMLIRHSDNFFTALSGMDRAYFSEGDKVFKNVPVGYSEGKSASLCFLDGDSVVIANYTVVDNAVVWAV